MYLIENLAFFFIFFLNFFGIYKQIDYKYRRKNIPLKFYFLISVLSLGVTSFIVYFVNKMDINNIVFIYLFINVLLVTIGIALSSFLMNLILKKYFFMDELNTYNLIGYIRNFQINEKHYSFEEPIEIHIRKRYDFYNIYIPLFDNYENGYTIEEAMYYVFENIDSTYDLVYGDTGLSKFTLSIKDFFDENLRVRDEKRSGYNESKYI